MNRPHYKFIYFNSRGLGEAVRLIFAHAGVEYEREDIDYTDKSKGFDELKPLLPFGQLPVLEVDGKMLHQSMAICRYLAKKFGLLAADDWNNAHADATALSMMDLIHKASRYYQEKDETRKQELFNEFETVHLPYCYVRLNDILKKHGGHFAGKLTWIDFYVTGITEAIDGLLKKKSTEKYPFLKKLVNEVLDLPNVKEYVATRPFNPVMDF